MFLPPTYLQWIKNSELEPHVLTTVLLLQIGWLWQKVDSEDDKGFQRFLDSSQYKCNSILRYERVFGPGYVSTGGFGRFYVLRKFAHYHCIVINH